MAIRLHKQNSLSMQVSTRNPLDNPMQVAQALPFIHSGLGNLAGMGDAALGCVLFYKF